jgi:nicotinate-nucleotide adenylyltransferase
MGMPIFSSGRVAFFGGSFDPPHLGHLAVARAAQAALGLDSVLFAPVGAQPLKPAGSTADFADRLAMTQLSIAGETGFAISLADAPKPQGEPNYTLETLVKLRAELPAESTLFFLMGADSFAGLKRWHRAAEIPFVTPLIVASRPGERWDDLEKALPEGLSMEAEQEEGWTALGVEVRLYELKNEADERTQLYLLPGLEIEISASEIREQVAGHRLAGTANGGRMQERELLSAHVAEYIRAHGLYL